MKLIIPPFFSFLIYPMITLSLLITSCSYLPYEESKVEIVQINQKITSANYDDEEFLVFLQNKNYATNSLPFKSWGLQELLLAQEFFNHDFKIAKKEWETIQIDEKIALLNPPNSIGIAIGRGDSNEEISKNLFGAGFSFTFETANKRIIRHEIAFNKTQLALLNYESINWKLKNELIRKIFKFAKNQNLINNFKTEVKLKKSILDMLFNRVNLGIASRVDYDLLALELNDVYKNLSNYQFQQQALNKEIATLVGMSTEKFNLLPMNHLDLEQSLEKVTVNFLDQNKINVIKTNALIHNINLRSMLAAYAIREAELKYEYAKQYPDFTFSPAYAYEFGNNVWQLGIDSLLTSSNRNEVFISRAEKIRDIEAAKIINYQFQLNNDIELLKNNFSNLKDQLVHARKINSKKNDLSDQLMKRFNEGLLDRLELERELINLSKFDRQLHDAIYNLIDLGLEAEAIFQINIFNYATDFYEQ